MEVRIADVIVDDRVRHVYGDLDPLERNIERMGILQPIGITPDKKLLFGARRLKACKNIGLDTIPARVFDIEADDPVAALEMERAENEYRLDLTPSEKVEIALRIEEALGNRVGRPKKDKGEIVVNSPQLEKGKKTRDIAAEAVNWSGKTYERAKTVIESGNEEVIRQMDSGEKSISAAYETIKKPDKPKTKTFKITLYKNPGDDALLLLERMDSEYCVSLACELLRLTGNKVEVEEKE